MVPRPVGGIRGLCDLLDEYGDALQADFRQFYSGLDIADVWRGLLSPRDALVLAAQLAFVPSSRYRALALGGVQFIGWDPNTSVLSDIHDAVVDNSVVTIKSAGGKSQRPEAYPRPQPKAVAPPTVVPSIENFPIHMVMALTQMQKK